MPTILIGRCALESLSPENWINTQKQFEIKIREDYYCGCSACNDKKLKLMHKPNPAVKS